MARRKIREIADRYAGLRNQDLDKLAAERAQKGGKFLGTDERGLPTMGRLTPEQEAEAAAVYAERLRGGPGFEEAARVTAAGRLPGMPDDLPETTGRALAQMGAVPRTGGPSLAEAFAGSSPESYAGERFRSRYAREKALAQSDATEPPFPSSPEMGPPDLRESYAGETFAERAQRAQREKALAQSDATEPPFPSSPEMGPPDLRESYAGETFAERAQRAQREKALAQSDATEPPFPSSPEMGPPDLRESYAGETFAERAQREKELIDLINRFNPPESQVD